MAFIGTQIVVGVKGITDPFTLIARVKQALREQGDRRQRNSVEEFTRAAQCVLDYEELLQVCDRYVYRDESKDQDANFESRKMYNDTPVSSRELIWKVAEMLFTHSKVGGKNPDWTVHVFENWNGPELWLNSNKMPSVGSPTFRFEDRHGVMMAKIKSTHGPLILNTTVPKALLNIPKITEKLLEHAALAVAQRENRDNAEQQRLYKAKKAKQLVTAIETKYDLPRYYPGSEELVFKTEGIQLRIQPSEYGHASITVGMMISNETELENLEPIITMLKSIKAKNDHEAAKRLADQKREVKA